MAYIEIRTDDRAIIHKLLQKHTEMEHADITLDRLGWLYRAVFTTEREEAETPVATNIS